MSPENRQSVLSPAAAHKFELIGRISSGLAHELNGPIGIAMGFSELAKEAIDNSDSLELSSADKSKVRGYLDMIKSASLRARNLSRGIWNFAKAELGTTDNIDLIELMDTVQYLTAPAVKVAQIDVTRRASNSGISGVESYAYSPLTQQILVELILASPQSIPGGGLIVWEVDNSNDGDVTITLTAETWNEEATSEWIAPDYVRESFAEMGGSVSEAEPVSVISQTEEQQELTGWKVVCTLRPPTV